MIFKSDHRELWKKPLYSQSWWCTEQVMVQAALVKKSGRAKLDSGLVQEVGLTWGDRDGGGSVCMSSSLLFTRCEDQRCRRRIVTSHINPITAKRERFYSVSWMRQAELMSCKICSLFNQFPQLRTSVWWSVPNKASPWIQTYFASVDSSNIKHKQ